MQVLVKHLMTSSVVSLFAEHDVVVGIVTERDFLRFATKAIEMHD